MCNIEARDRLFPIDGAPRRCGIPSVYAGVPAPDLCGMRCSPVNSAEKPRWILLMRYVGASRRPYAATQAICSQDAGASFLPSSAFSLPRTG